MPGIDDGATDWEMSLGMVKASWKAGVRTIIATPHFLPWKEDNHTGEVYANFERSIEAGGEKLESWVAAE